MKHAPRLELEPRPSRIAGAFIAASFVATIGIVVLLRIPWWAKASAVVAIAGVSARELWRCAGRGVPALVFVGDNRRLTVSDRNGRVSDGDIVDASYVGATITTIVWRADHAPWWRPARTILILPDMLPADDFRRLRVLLRYGLPETRAATKGVDAG
jgi:hypothetical protein